MIAWLTTLSSSEQWAFGIAAMLFVGVVSQWVGQRLNHSFALARERKKPVFFSLGPRYKILAVHRYEVSDDVSGYRHLGQNSRPDQWQKLVTIESSVFGFRHKVIPIESQDILDVVISRDGKEQWKVIPFNK
jgi:hypothetical protein